MKLDNDSSDAPSTTSSGSVNNACVNHNNASTVASTTASGGGAPMPKHIPFPDMSSSGSEVLNELVMFLFTSCAAAMQFINIYRTIWWLPESYINHTVNLYLIEPYLIVFIMLMTARRLVYRSLLHVLEFVCRNKLPKMYRSVTKYSFASVLMALLAVCIAQIYARQTYLSFFLLVYPLVVYLLIFGFQIEPFLRTTCEVEGSYFNGMPMHCCSSSPSTIREEIELLKNDFNNRFKQVIFTSVVNAYYAGFVPCFFAQNFIYYNVLWATQHIVFIWLSGFTMCTMFCFPAKYSDILHRASLHLGQWYRLDGRHGGGAAAAGVGLPPSVWSKTVAWPNGSVVRYTGELFRCIGPVTVALPGSTSHSRFFKLFHNPDIIYMVLTGVQATIVMLQLLFLYYAIEWHFVLSISFLALTNQFTFFKIMRDYLITKRVYATETSITDRMNATHYN